MGKGQIICVLGMHRSGTSLVTRVVNLLGVSLGREESMMAPDAANCKGYWEHRASSELNEEILSRVGGSWDQPPTAMSGWEVARELADLRERGRGLIEEEFDLSETWGWKDPRNCLTLPFWQWLLPPMHYLICVRNPIDVAMSLERRNGFPLSKGFHLWLTYMKSALRHTSDRPRHVVLYENWLENAEAELGHLAAFLGRSAEVTAEVKDFVDRALQHHRTSVVNVVDDARLGFPAKALYLALRLFAGLQRQQPDNSTFTNDTPLRLLDIFSLYAAEAMADGDKLRAQVEEQERQSAAEKMALQLAESAREAAQREVTDLHELLAKQTKRSAELMSKVASLSRHEKELRQMFLETQEQLLRRDEELQAALGAALQDISTGLGGTSRKLIIPSKHLQYRHLIRQIQEVVQRTLPPQATTLVVSKGDNDLLQLDGRPAWHFPQTADGVYAGHYPATGEAAIAHLESLRAKGADFLLFPSTGLWWLDHYKEFREHLERHYRLVFREPETCLIFSLREPPGQGAAGAVNGAAGLHGAQGLAPAADAGYRQLIEAVQKVVQNNLPAGSTVLVASKGDSALLKLDGRPAWHFPQTAEGVYAGHHPADSEAAIAHLEALRAKGAEFLLFPSTSFWWLGYYRDFQQHLESRYRIICRDQHCLIYDLGKRRARLMRRMLKRIVATVSLRSRHA